MAARWYLLPVLALLTGTLAALADPVFPALSGRVVDQANLLDAAQEQELTRKLAALEEQTTDQFVIVTLPSLQGESIEEFGVRLGRHWAIGQRDRNNGVLLLVAPQERQVRIEVGYGLEGELTDALARVIIETSILPRFRAGDMAGGIIAGAEDIIAVLSGRGQAIKQRAAPGFTFAGDGLAIVMIIFFLLVVALILFNLFQGLTTGRGGRWSGSSSGGSWGSSGGGFSGGGGSFGGGGSSGRW